MEEEIDCAIKGYNNLRERINKGNLIFFLKRAELYSKKQRYDDVGRCLNEAVNCAREQKKLLKLSDEDIESLEYLADKPIVFSFRLKYGKSKDEVEDDSKYVHPDEEVWLPNQEEDEEDYVSPLEETVEEEPQLKVEEPKQEVYVPEPKQEEPAPKKEVYETKLEEVVAEPVEVAPQIEEPEEKAVEELKSEYFGIKMKDIDALFYMDKITAEKIVNASEEEITALRNQLENFLVNNEGYVQQMAKRNITSIKDLRK